MSNLSTKTIQYSVYDRTNGTAKYVEDTASYTRPDIEMLSDTIKGAGIMGEIDLPTLGAISAMAIEMTLNKTNKSVVELFSPGVHIIETRWVNNVMDSSTGETSIQGNKEIMKVLPKTLGMGDIESNETNEGTYSAEVLTYEYIVDGESLLKIDKLNNVFIVNGVDYSEALRNAL